MKNKTYLEKIIYIILLILIIGVPFIKLLSYFLYLGNITQHQFDINQVNLLWVSIPFLIGTYVYGIYTKRIKISYLDIICYILILLSISCTINSINEKISFYGSYGRNEGLLSILSYYLIFLNAKNITNKKYRNNILNVFIFVGMFQVLYAILQVYTTIPYIARFSMKYMGMGLCANPNFFGSYTLMLLVINTVYYLVEKKNKYLIFSIIFFIGLSLAQSTGPFLTYIIVLIFILIYYRKKINYKIVIILLLYLIPIYFLVDYTSVYINEEKGITIYSKYNIKEEIKTVVKAKSVRITDDRIDIWKNSFSIVKRFWKNGTGFDTYGIIYRTTYYQNVDKAHNIYIHMLATSGVFYFLIYCMFCLSILINGFKYKDTLSIALFVAFIAYSIQGFLNISVIDVAPYFYLILGLLNVQKER